MKKFWEYFGMFFILHLWIMKVQVSASVMVYKGLGVENI